MPITDTSIFGSLIDVLSPNWRRPQKENARDPNADAELLKRLNAARKAIKAGSAVAGVVDSDDFTHIVTERHLTKSEMLREFPHLTEADFERILAAQREDDE